MSGYGVRRVGDRVADGDSRCDVVVVGGGAAGLSGALTLARARRSVVVVDGGQPRNAPADAIHGYLGREGTPPGDLLRTGCEEVQAFGGRLLQGRVVAVEREEPGFAVRLADGGAVRGRRLLVATGLVDELPELPGLAELWGTGVLHCPYCHGWEVRDQPIGVLAGGPLTVHQALLWRQWSEDVTVLRHTAPEPSPDEYEQLAARGVTVVDGEVVAVERDGSGLTGVRLAGDVVVPCRALVVAPRFTARVGLLAGLGLEPVEQEVGGAVIGSCLVADSSGQTSVPGLWVAGNATNPIDTVIGSAAAGVRAGSAINADLVAEDTRRAVAARRDTGTFSAASERRVSDLGLGSRRRL